MRPKAGPEDIFPKCGLRIAVSGKGGVGKTIIAAMIGRYLTQRQEKVLLVDADPAMGLAYLFDIDTSKTIGTYRDRLRTERETRRQLESSKTKDVIEREALIHLDAYTSMLIMGKDEADGCFCGINEVLKYGIGAMAKDYDAMVVDCEAGLEQIKRRVLHSVNVLLIISDMTARGIRTARLLAELSARGDPDVIFPEQTGLVINRYRGNEGFCSQAEAQTGLTLLGVIPEDDAISEIDTGGGRITDLPAGAASYLAVTAILDKLLAL